MCVKREVRSQGKDWCREGGGWSEGEGGVGGSQMRRGGGWGTGWGKVSQLAESMLSG